MGLIYLDEPDKITVPSDIKESNNPSGSKITESQNNAIKKSNNPGASKITKSQNNGRYASLIKLIVGSGGLHFKKYHKREVLINGTGWNN